MKTKHIIIVNWGDNMFVYVKKRCRKKTLLQKLFDNNNRDILELKRVELYNAAPFFVADFYGESDEAWLELAHITEKYGPIITEKAAIVPECVKDKLFFPEVLPLKMLCRTIAASDLSNVVDLRKCRTAVFDKGAFLKDEIEMLLNVFSQLIVVTDNLEKYEAIANSIFSKSGGVFMISDTPMSAYGCDLVISERYDYCKDLNCKICITSFSDIENSNIVKPQEFEMPKEYDKLWDKQTDKIMFASALYELCSYKCAIIPKYNDINKIYSLNS